MYVKVVLTVIAGLLAGILADQLSQRGRHTGVYASAAIPVFVTNDYERRDARAPMPVEIVGAVRVNGRVDVDVRNVPQVVVGGGHIDARIANDRPIQVEIRPGLTGR